MTAASVVQVFGCLPETAVMYIIAAAAEAAESRLAVDSGPWVEATGPALEEVAT